MENKKHLDVGCGSKPRNPYNCEHLYGIDIIDQHSDEFIYKKCNIVLENLPFENSTFDSISAFDFLEHIPRFAVIKDNTQFPFINFMNEAYRVLKKDGKFYAITPVYPRTECFVDPTHINFITKKTHRYFTTPTNYAEMYGFKGEFEIIKVKVIRSNQEINKRSKLKAFFKDIYYNIFFTKKGHILWEFKAIKDK